MNIQYPPPTLPSLHTLTHTHTHSQNHRSLSREQLEASECVMCFVWGHWTVMCGDVSAALTANTHPGKQIMSAT